MYTNKNYLLSSTIFFFFYFLLLPNLHTRAFAVSAWQLSNIIYLWTLSPRPISQMPWSHSSFCYPSSAYPFIPRGHIVVLPEHAPTHLSYPLSTLWPKLQELDHVISLLKTCWSHPVAARANPSRKPWPLPTSPGLTHLLLPHPHLWASCSSNHRCLHFLKEDYPCHLPTRIPWLSLWCYRIRTTPINVDLLPPCICSPTGYSAREAWLKHVCFIPGPSFGLPYS